jgi:hypothetical protein
VRVRPAGLRGAGGVDEKNGLGTREVCSVLFLEVFGGRDRHGVADVSLFALKLDVFLACLTLFCGDGNVKVNQGAEVAQLVEQPIRKALLPS